MKMLFLLPRIIAWTLVAPFVMRLGPARAFECFRPASVSASPTERIDDLVAIADRVLLFRIFGRLLFRTRCYKRTLILYRLLRVHGHEAVAWIGLDLDRDGIAGHAWVTVEGKRIVDPTFSPSREFTPFLAIGDHVERLTGA